ncbi:methyltransferase domain-containing protein [Aequorivita echinoideorum]|uniref:Methyltransferase domain-containing protein n=1 Tax=Aequorivita echinoideorum TaxID=1549647 RepID=A0ABS5S8C0_9FLAO|nr:methyltransferase domain-containing protein [Aequorivita echinoideorum]MBT0608685.1 methyltransferase domain-containing protein [Aequorivita echinoideorum]
MIYFSNKERSKQPEIMDDFHLQGNEMKVLLNDLKRVNRWLGGNSVTLDGIEILLKNYSKKDKITIIDFGCGDGEMLRQCAKFGHHNGYNFNLIGIDFNPNILIEASKKSDGFPNISYQKMDVFSAENLIPNCDIALCTLFLHHFRNEKIEFLLKKILNKTSIGVVINDLQRSRIAFQLFKLISNPFLKTKIARHDGLVSVARGFKKQELALISTKLDSQHNSIKWRWAFRYQWIIKKTNP